MIRFASANWQGPGKNGKGIVSSQSLILNNAKYTYSSRFEDGAGTNPEELVAAAHASCFTMKLSFLVSDAGYIPENIDTRCEVTFDTQKGVIILSHLIIKATVADLDKAKFDELVVNAKENCPVSKLLKATITWEATLNKSAVTV